KEHRRVRVRDGSTAPAGTVSAGPVSAVNVADQICTYFGGAYDATTHTYRTPQLSVTNLDGPVVRRSPPKRDDHTTDYSLGAPGVPAGCLILVQLEDEA